MPEQTHSKRLTHARVFKRFIHRNRPGSRGYDSFRYRHQQEKCRALKQGMMQELLTRKMRLL